jgi:cytidine deaminase
LSASDRQSPDRWPQKERRSGADRRSGRDRRVGLSKVAEAPDGKERRHGERRHGERRNEQGWEPVTFDAMLATGFSPEQDLLTAAGAARAHAHAQYSRFKVGAALETVDGAIVTGCNIENATYGLTLCAERVALVKALSEGHTTFTRIAVVAETDSPTPPCGSCRQVLWEYCGDIEVILGNGQAVTGHYRLASLLPLPFDRRLL